MNWTGWHHRKTYRPLARRFAVWMSGLTLCLLLLLGASESYFGYIQSLERIEFAQELQAQAAAREVASFMESIGAGLRGIAKLPWTRPDFDVRERRHEFHRLMQGTPAVISLQAVDRRGREQLLISREAVDRVATLTEVEEANLATQARPGEMRAGRTFFRDGALPTVRVGVADDQGGVVATVDLRLLGDVVAQPERLRERRLGVYRAGRQLAVLIAHTRIHCKP